MDMCIWKCLNIFISKEAANHSLYSFLSAATPGMNSEFLLGEQMTLLTSENARDAVPSRLGGQGSEASF